VAAAIELARVTARFATPAGGVHTVLQDISLDVAEGTFVAIVGPSGCGKSTLLNVAAGLLAPPEGSVRVFGETLDGINRHAAYLFQQDALLPWRSVLDNVRLGLDFRRVPLAEATRKARRFIARVGLEGFEDRFPHQLSGGMRKRVAIAQSWIVDPRILLMDEPFAALDALTRETMQQELLRISAAAGTTIVFITHQIDEAIFLGDRVAVLEPRPGRLRELITIDLARPRSAGLKQSPEFQRYVARIGGLIGAH
jgi:NitT/TauT family transport system ATP-binding protein